MRKGREARLLPRWGGISCFSIANNASARETIRREGGRETHLILRCTALKLLSSGARETLRGSRKKETTATGPTLFRLCSARACEADAFLDSASASQESCRRFWLPNVALVRSEARFLFVPPPHTTQGRTTRVARQPLCASERQTHQ